VSLQLSERAPIRVDRNNVVYLFERLSTPKTHVSNSNEDEVLLCIDFSEVEGSCFVADMGPVTRLVQEYKRDSDVFSFDLGGSLSEWEGGLVRLAERHLGSITRVSDVCGSPPIDAYDVEWMTPSRIPPEAIVCVGD
jgi:hypothetical protein